MCAFVCVWCRSKINNAESQMFALMEINVLFTASPPAVKDVVRVYEYMYTTL